MRSQSIHDESPAGTASADSYIGDVIEGDDTTPTGPDVTGELEPIGAGAAAEVEASSAGDEKGVDGPRRGGMTTLMLQGAAGLAVLFLVFLTPFRISTVEEIIAIGLLGFAVFEAISVFRRRGPRREYIQPVVALVAAVILFIWPSETLVVAGYFLAGVIAVRGVLDIWGSARRWHEQGANSWVFTRGLILVTVAALAALFPSQSVTALVIGGALVAVSRAGLAVWFTTVHRDALSKIDPSNTYAVVTYWLSRREMDAADAEDVEQRVFIHKGDTKARVWRFAVLLGLAATIATFGIASDSTAVVIGAMLLAPLMTPILGTAAGLINGKTRATLISGGIAVAGIAGTIVLSWALTIAIPDLQAVIQNSQVTSRTAPSLGDLIIALAAGAAGAYGVSRAESTDALPGVAVAIALVPPLSVVGITLHAGDFSQAFGAMLLFLTNLFSIVLMAGLVFVAVGYSSWGSLYYRRNTIRVSFAAVTLAVVLISIPLALTAQGIIQSSTDLRTATNTVSDWLDDDSPTRINDITLDGDTVTVQLIGPEQPPSTTGLSEDMGDRMGRQITAVVRWIEEQEDVATHRG